MTTDGDRLASVTWLFGAPPEQPATETAESPSESSPTESGDTKPGVFKRLNNVSMNALARRGMSVAEMHAYLLGREFDEAEAAEECSRLESVGLLDDFALAETLIRTLRDRKGLGRSGITAELRRRKIDSEAIEAALEDLDDDELARAIELAERRAPQLRSLDRVTAERRLSGFLMRKGYSGGVARAAVDRALGQQSSSAGPVFR